MSGTVMWSAAEMLYKVSDSLGQVSWVVPVDREEQLHKAPSADVLT